MQKSWQGRWRRGNDGRGISKKRFWSARGAFQRGEESGALRPGITRWWNTKRLRAGTPALRRLTGRPDQTNRAYPCSPFSDEIALEPVWKLRGALFSWKRPDGATKENIPGGSSTEEQRSQTAFSPKTLRAAGLLSVAGVGSFLTARCGDARNSPPWPQPKSLAAAPLVVSKQALSAPPVFPSATRRAHWPSRVRVRHTG